MKLFLCFTFHALIMSTTARELKTLVLVIASDNLPVYVEFQKSWKSFMHSDPEHFECYFLCGNPYLPSRYVIEGDTIWTQTEENSIPGLLNKTLVAFEAFFPRLDEFDYIVRSNLSSFLVFPRLLKFLNTLPKNNCYSGIHHGEHHSRYPSGWVCGAGMILSPDIVKKLLGHRTWLFDRMYAESYYDDPVMDDVLIGYCLAKDQTPIIPSKYVEIYSPSDWLNIENIIPPDVFHFRIKTDPQYRDEWDPYIHSRLLEIFY